MASLSLPAYDYRGLPIATATATASAPISRTKTKTSRLNTSSSGESPPSVSYPLGALHEMRPQLKQWYNKYARPHRYLSDMEDNEDKDDEDMDGKEEQAQVQAEEMVVQDTKDGDIKDHRILSSSLTEISVSTKQPQSYLNISDFFHIAQEAHCRARQTQAQAQAPTVPNPNSNPGANVNPNLNPSSPHIPIQYTMKSYPYDKGRFYIDPFMGYACLVVDKRLGESVNAWKLSLNWTTELQGYGREDEIR